MRKCLPLTALVVLFAFSFAQARDQIHIVGSSPILPFLQTVAEHCSHSRNLSAPHLDVTGTGKGFRLFCAGVGFQYPDLNATSRPITDAELAKCNENGVSGFTEIEIGLDGVVIVNLKESPRYNFTVPQLFNALASEVEAGGRLVENPYTHWNEAAPSLPDYPIEVIGPEPSSPENEAFLQLVMAEGCKAFPQIAALGDPKRFAICRSLRKAPEFIEGLRYESSIIEWLQEHPQGFGIASFQMFSRNQDLIQGNPVNGVQPTLENMAKGKYPLSRPIYRLSRIYIHLVQPALNPFHTGSCQVCSSIDMLNMHTKVHPRDQCHTIVIKL